MKVNNIILTAFVSSSAIFCGVQADNPYPCKRQNCKKQTFNKNQCAREDLCYDCDPAEICDRLCASCDYQDDGTYAGVPCDCDDPPPPPKCDEACLLEEKGKWTCSSEQGCQDCYLFNDDACEIMCKKCGGDNNFGGLPGCECDGHNPEEKCEPACSAFPKGKWVCGSAQGCAGCHSSNCDTLCEKCGADGEVSIAGLDCDCSPAPPSGKCDDACSAFPKGKWVCDSLQGCGGCDDSLCYTLCDKCGLYGSNTIAGLDCDCGDYY